MKSIHTLFTCILILGSISAFGSSGFETQVDTLVLTHKRTGEVIKITEGTEMNAQIFGDIRIEGKLNTLSNDKIHLGDKSVQTDALLTIKYKDPRKQYERSLGQVGVGGGLAAIIGGGALIALGDEPSSAWVPSFSLVLGLMGIIIGIGLIAFGAFMSRSSAKNIKKWYTVSVIKGSA